MRFSIITITYNSQTYLEETLRSVKEQVFTDYEHIIWDGGSHDNTLQIARKFPHIKIYQGKDLGISDAMNKGASFAQGEFILHLHSDDLLEDKYTLERVNSFLKDFPKTSWIYGRARIIDSNGHHMRSTNFIPYSAKRLRKYNIITHPATFLSRPLFIQSGGFNKDLKFCMDYELWLRLSQITPAQAMPHFIAKFREHSQSLSTKESLSVANEAYKVRNAYTKNLWERWKSYRTWKARCRACKQSKNL